MTHDLAAFDGHHEHLAACCTLCLTVDHRGVSMTHSEGCPAMTSDDPDRGPARQRAQAVVDRWFCLLLANSAARLPIHWDCTCRGAR